MARRYNNKKSAPKKQTSKDFYMMVAEAILPMLDEGLPPWSPNRQKANISPYPVNFATGKPYRGVNMLNLMITSIKNGFDSNYYMTINQTLKIAGIERSDPDILEKSPIVNTPPAAPVMFYGSNWKDRHGKTWYTVENGQKRFEPTPEEAEKQELKKRFFTQTSSVNALDQMDLSKIPEKHLAARGLIAEVVNKDLITGNIDNELAEKVETMRKGLGIEIVHNQLTATPYYDAKKDHIVMPPKEMYNSLNDYYSTTFHEMVHATGHKSRLNRESLYQYNSSTEVRAYEEFVAELGGLFIGAELQIKPITSEGLANHASYLQSWAKHIREDLANNKADFFMKACKDAEKAVKMLMKSLDNKLENNVEAKAEKKAPSVDLDDGPGM